MIRLWLPMTPVAKGRPRMTMTGRCYTPAKTRDAEAAMILMVNPQLGHKFKPLDGPLRVTLMFGLKQAKSNRNAYPISRPDLDNYVKTFLDSMNGILWHDDSQVVEIIASKFWAVEAGIECWLEPITGDNT